MVGIKLVVVGRTLVVEAERSEMTISLPIHGVDGGWDAGYDCGGLM